MSFITTKFQEILLSGFRGENKKNRTDGLTDSLTDGSKTLYPPQLVAWCIIKGVLKKDADFDWWYM